jgi:hypothetical protein
MATLARPRPVEKCVAFAELWYSGRAISKVEILEDFSTERFTIAAYLTTHNDHDIVNQALDLFSCRISEDAAREKSLSSCA